MVRRESLQNASPFGQPTPHTSRFNSGLNKSTPKNNSVIKNAPGYYRKEATKRKEE